MPVPPLRVCHVIHSLGPGGAESVLVELAAVAADAGIDLSVVCLSPIAGAVNAHLLVNRGVPVTGVEIAGRWDPRGIPLGVRAIETHRPDVVHAHLKHADLVATAAAWRLGVPFVSTLHLIEDAVTPAGRAKRRLAATVRSSRASMTLAVSAALRDWYLDVSGADPQRVRVLHNGVQRPPVDTTTRPRLRAALGISPDATVAMMIGIMRPGKGHAELLAAAARTGDEVRYVLVGDGPLRPALEATAASLPPGRVTFAGYRTDVADVLTAADLVVHPSRFDALPTALISALAVGRPVVASAVGGIPEIVTPDVGLLVPPDDPAALAAAVTALAADPQVRMRLGAAALRRFEAEFEAELWARRLRGLYDEVRQPWAVRA